MTCFAKMPNIYATLDIPDTEETENLTRKANKKLREIEKLKLKSKKTPDEYAKIHEEEIWQAIAIPADAIPSETEEQIAKRNAKQREKTKLKEQQQKQRKEKEKHKQEIILLKKKFQERYQEQSRNMLELKQEQNRNMLKLKQENAKLHYDIEQFQNIVLQMKKIITTLKESEPNTSEPQISSIIEKEYHEKYQASGTHKKTWYEMMRKYHPDKFKENKELADAFSNVLNRLKEKYLE